MNTNGEIFPRNFNQISTIFQEEWIQNVVCKTEGILSRPQCVIADIQHKLYQNLVSMCVEVSLNSAGVDHRHIKIRHQKQDVLSAYKLGIMMTSSNENIFRVTGGFPSQRPVAGSFDVFFDVHLNKHLSKQSWCRWFETTWRLLWRHCDEYKQNVSKLVNCIQLNISACTFENSAPRHMYDNLCHAMLLCHMMTSSNGNIFRVTGPLCGEFTGPGEFPTQRPVTRSFDVFFHLCLNKRLNKQQWGWWFETLSWSSWRHSNERVSYDT